MPTRAIEREAARRVLNRVLATSRERAPAAEGSQPATEAPQPSKRAILRARKQRIAQWLIWFDRYLYGISASVRLARMMMFEDGVDPQGISVGKLAAKHCEFWRVHRTRRRASRRRLFHKAEWQTLEGWLLRNDARIDRERDTPASVCMRMRNARILTNPYAVVEALKSRWITLPEKPADIDFARFDGLRLLPPEQRRQQDSARPRPPAADRADCRRERMTVSFSELRPGDRITTPFVTFDVLREAQESSGGCWSVISRLSHPSYPAINMDLTPAELPTRFEVLRPRRPVMVDQWNLEVGDIIDFGESLRSVEVVEELGGARYAMVSSLSGDVCCGLRRFRVLPVRLTGDPIRVSFPVGCDESPIRGAAEYKVISRHLPGVYLTPAEEEPIVPSMDEIVEEEAKRLAGSREANRRDGHEPEPGHCPNPRRRRADSGRAAVPA